MTQALCDALQAVRSRLRPPLGIVLGSPRQAAELAEQMAGCTCYQMDLHQAERLRDELASRSIAAHVITTPDLWDLPADFQTLVYPAPRGGERALKLDMLEQTYQVLRLQGTLIVLSPYENDPFFPGAIRKLFGRVHVPGGAEGTVFWSQKSGERPRRRHEIVYHVQRPEGASLVIHSRPGVFSYGRFDEGARALVETMAIGAGEAILDLGCGCGTNGIIAALRGGPASRVAFVDSNVRALALAQLNAQNNGVRNFEVLPPEDLPMRQNPFDVVLANPPYYAQLAIAERFLDMARSALRRGGRLYLVTKRADSLGERIAERFEDVESLSRRGYAVFCARRR